MVAPRSHTPRAVGRLSCRLGDSDVRVGRKVVRVVAATEHAGARDDDDDRVDT